MINYYWIEKYVRKGFRALDNFMLREIDKMQAKNFEDRVDNYVDSLQDQYYEGYKAACEDLAKIIRQTKDLKTTRVGREKN